MVTHAGPVLDSTGARARGPAVAARARPAPAPEQVARGVLVTTVVLVDLVLLAGSLAYLALDGDGARLDPVLGSSAWNADLDASFLELWGYVQLVGAVVCLAAVWWVRRTGVHLAWALVVATVATDDFLMVHERAGAWLVRADLLRDTLGLRAVDVGELLAWALLAVVPGVLLVVAHVRAPRPARRDSWRLAGALGVLIAFGVVLDMVHILVEASVPAGVATALTVLESAGEIAAMSLLLLLAAGMALRAPGDRAA